jgi:hypothetical protein
MSQNQFEEIAEQFNINLENVSFIVSSAVKGTSMIAPNQYADGELLLQIPRDSVLCTSNIDRFAANDKSLKALIEHIEEAGVGSS